MKINISEILSNPSVIKNFKVEPDFEKLKLRRGSYPVSYKEPFPKQKINFMLQVRRRFD